MANALLPGGMAAACGAWPVGVAARGAGGVPATADKGEEEKADLCRVPLR